ncbi:MULTISPECIES: hypothetical protein [Bacillus cereus group]|uniref:Group-specific protein n=1 Tax=Bacillus cereus TaxID=1396 RepID=A0A2B1DQ94_BACCE|nr:hypothetical protein [Bacillus cereus]PDY75759.1 hypothetical protein CON06_29500 [Bacillus cereus]PFA12675.1 hypothetical protein CN382_15185 [Bacillus cereus]PFM39937.1 hypothetical protein COJ43_14065 [Bacillus cereus]PGL56765.1 hypothetical protein CN927_27645 [Bacillus cereus]PGQ07865.1 hypothetical protein COA08_17185 [Bacillus cereus]
MHLKYGKHINILSIILTVFSFFAIVSISTWLSEYSIPNISKMLMVTMLSAFILGIIGFRQEKSALAIIIMGICAFALVVLYIYAVINFLEH